MQVEWKKNEIVVRNNANPSLLTDEQIWSQRDLYMDYLVRFHRDTYYSRPDKVDVCFSDAIASKLTFYLSERFFAVMPSFYDSHKPDGTFIDDSEMLPHRQVLEQIDKQSDLLGMFREISKNLLRDGHTLWRPFLNDQSIFDWDVFGDWECPPIYWLRYGAAHPEPNRIKTYIINYVPRPSIGGSPNLHGIHKTYSENEIYHLHIGSWNDGYGWSYLLRAWDSITKLRYASNADQFLRDVRFLILVPQSWKKDRIDRFVDTVDNWTHSRALIMKAEQDQMKQPTGLPAVGAQNMMMPGTTSSGQGGMFQKSTTGETLQDPEYGRLFIATGFNKTWFVGTEAGTELGGAANFTDDILAEIQIFRLMEPIFKRVIETILSPLIENGQLPPLPLKWCLKSWKEDEILQSQTMAIQHEMTMMDHKADTEGRNKEKRENTRNHNYHSWVNERLIAAIRLNSSMPMTPVMSSWVESVGAYKGQLLVKFHGESDIFGYSYGGQQTDPSYTSEIGLKPDDMGEQKYLEMTDAGSKGGWLWDNILQRPSQYGMASGKLFEKGSKIKHQTPPGRPARFKYNPVGSFGEGIGTGQTAEEMKEKKMEGYDEFPGLGTSREPWTMSGMKTKPKPTETGKPTGLGYNVPSGYEGIAPLNPSIQQPKETPYPIYYNAFDLNIKNTPYELSRKRFNELSKTVLGHTFGDKTIDRIKNLWKEWETQLQNKDVFRVNSMAKGTGLTWTPLYYREDGKILEEYPCMSDYKRLNMGREVPLEVYHRNEEYVVGTYKVIDWNDGKDEPIAELYYDDVLLEGAIKRLNAQESRLAKKFYAGLVPDISEEYHCNVNPKWFSKRENRDIRLQRDILIQRVALVDYGNCPDYKCIVNKVNEQCKTELIK